MTEITLIGGAGDGKVITKPLPPAGYGGEGSSAPVIDEYTRGKYAIFAAVPGADAFREIPGARERVVDLMEYGMSGLPMTYLVADVWATAERHAQIAEKFTRVDSAIQAWHRAGETLDALGIEFMARGCEKAVREISALMKPGWTGG